APHVSPDHACDARVPGPDAILGDAAKLAPLGDGHPAAMTCVNARAAGSREAARDRVAIQGARNIDLHAPGDVRFPAGVAQVICYGGERVRLARPDIRAAVAVAIDRD